MTKPVAHPKKHFEPKEVKQGTKRDCPATPGVNLWHCLALHDVLSPVHLDEAWQILV